MVAFFVSSMLVVVLLAFGHTQADGHPVFGTTTKNFAALWDPVYLELFLRSLGYALATVVLSVVVAYPVAYAIALHGGRYKNALIAAIVGFDGVRRVKPNGPAARIWRGPKLSIALRSATAQKLISPATVATSTRASSSASTA